MNDCDYVAEQRLIDHYEDALERAVSKSHSKGFADGAANERLEIGLAFLAMLKSGTFTQETDGEYDADGSVTDRTQFKIQVGWSELSEFMDALGIAPRGLQSVAGALRQNGVTVEGL